MDKKEELHKKWQSIGIQFENLGYKIKTQVSGCVQNPITLTPEQIASWREQALKEYQSITPLMESYVNLVRVTLAHLREAPLVTYDVFVHHESNCVFYEVANDALREQHFNSLAELVMSDVTEEQAHAEVERIKLERGYE